MTKKGRTFLIEGFRNAMDVGLALGKILLVLTVFCGIISLILWIMNRIN